MQGGESMSIAEPIKDKHLVITLKKNNFNKTATAKELGITQPAVTQRLKKPDVKKMVDDIIEENLRRARITPTRLYKKISEGLEATRVIGRKSDNQQDDGGNNDQDGLLREPDFKERREYVQLGLKLMGHVRSDDESRKAQQINIIYGYRTEQPKIIDISD